MKVRTVLNNYPTKLPFTSTILYSFLLDYYNVSSLYWGIFITLASIYWLAAIKVKMSEESVDLDNEKELTKLPKTAFAQKLAELINQRKN